MENKDDKALEHFKGRKTAALAYIGLITRKKMSPTSISNVIKLSLPLEGKVPR